MQSKKRFTEINIWEAAWFMNLNKDQKLFWMYLNDRCDNIGVWEPNFKLASFNLGIENFQDFFDQFIDKINLDRERIIQISKEEWFLIDFVRFQYCRNNPLTRTNPARKSYLRLMQERNLWEWFCENQPDVMPIEDLLEYDELNPQAALDQSSSRVKEELSKRYKEKDLVKDKKKKRTDKDTPEKNKETTLEFEQRNKRMLKCSSHDLI